jgi:hypothetical protein
MLTVSRVAVELVAKFHPTGGRFPDQGLPQIPRAPPSQVRRPHRRPTPNHITEQGLAPDDLLFIPPLLVPPTEPSYLQLVTEPVDLGLTPPYAASTQYRHGTLTGYNLGGCKCKHCRGAHATYRAERRAAGKGAHPAPRTSRSRTLTTDRLDRELARTPCSMCGPVLAYFSSSKR